MLGNMEKTVSIPARNVLSALMRENTEQARLIRSMFQRAYVAQVQSSLNNKYISVPLEHNGAVANEMANTRKFILEALQQ